MGDRSEGTQNGVPSVFLCEMKRKGSAKLRLRHNHGNACVSCAMVHRRDTYGSQWCDAAMVRPRDIETLMVVTCVMVHPKETDRETYGGHITHMHDGASRGHR